jgi:hypothetical protein
MPAYLLTRHQCERCAAIRQTRATDDDGRPVTTAPPGWSRSTHKGRSYLVCGDCLHTGGMGAWLSEERESIMATTILLRHECDRCGAADEVDVTGKTSDPRGNMPEGWSLFSLQGKPRLFCPACVAALAAFAESNASAEQSP